MALPWCRSSNASRSSIGRLDGRGRLTSAKVSEESIGDARGARRRLCPAVCQHRPRDDRQGVPSRRRVFHDQTADLLPHDQINAVKAKKSIDTRLRREGLTACSQRCPPAQSVQPDLLCRDRRLNQRGSIQFIYQLVRTTGVLSCHQRCRVSQLVWTFAWALVAALLSLGNRQRPSF